MNEHAIDAEPRPLEFATAHPVPLVIDRLRALSAGARADAGCFRGVVHSVFARACNIALDDGRLLALLAAEHGNAPHAFRLEVPPGFAFDRVVSVGTRVVCRAGVLRAEGDSLCAALGAARRWHVALGELDAAIPATPAMRAAWRSGLRCLVRHGRAVKPGPPGLPRGRAPALRRAVRSGDRDAIESAVRGLVGCGHGLTPAGDDVLVGFLAGLHASAGGDAARRRVIDMLGEVVSAAADRTNRISRTYLLHAIEADFAEALTRLACVIANGAAAGAVDDAARRALAVGATSGRDGVRGLLLGFGAWANHRA